MTCVLGEPCVGVLDRACVDECPVEAICYEDDLPDRWRACTEENARFFAGSFPGRDEPLGSPGGAGKLGAVGADTPFAAAWRHGNSRYQSTSDGATWHALRTGPAPRGVEEAVMALIIYGDFNCPYSYLASQRADLLSEAGVTVDWQAVEHDRGLPVTGLPSGSDQASRDRELAEVASLALPGEQVPALPRMISNTEAAVAAYAEAVSDSVADELRRSLFRAIWVRGLHVSSPHEVRRLVTDLMWPQEDVVRRLASPDFPSLLLRDTDMTRIVRRSGGTIALNGVPLTTVGWRRVRQWQQVWLALPGQVVPTVIGSDLVVRPGFEGLRYLAEFAGAVGLPACLPAQARTAPGRDTPHAPAARAA